MLNKLLDLPGREVHVLSGLRGGPAVYYLVDREVQGVLINLPPFDPAILQAVNDAAPLKFIFLPSRLGARDVESWRQASGAETMAFDAEIPDIDGTVDIVMEKQSKLSRTIDLLPMSGRTRGSCALRLKNKPGVIFFGPILSAASASGWPTLIGEADDYSYENRVIGALGLQDVKYEYAFTDWFDPEHTRFGPGADKAIRAEIERVIVE